MKTIKKWIKMSILTVLSAMLLSSCGNAAQADDAVGLETLAGSAISTVETSSVESSIPQVLEEIPEEYFVPAQQQGTLVELHYDTYESMSYEQHTQTLQKRAIVYLPYGYSKEQQYNIFCLDARRLEQ